MMLCSYNANSRKVVVHVGVAETTDRMNGTCMQNIVITEFLEQTNILREEPIQFRT